MPINDVLSVALGNLCMLWEVGFVLYVSMVRN